MKVLQVLSSPIIRTNGIVTFIRESTAIMREKHQVDFLTDAKVDYDIRAYFNNYYDTDHINPKPTNDGPPIINFDQAITDRLRTRYEELNTDYDLIIAHDAQATTAFTDKNTIHYVHTAGLIGDNLTCLTDEYVSIERELLNKVRVGVQHQRVADNLGIKCEVLPMPMNNQEDYMKKSTDDSIGVLFIGEGTHRKGADIFIEKIDLRTAKIIASALPEYDFDGHQTYSFDEQHIREKIEFMRSAEYCYFPSRSEVFPYAIIEALLSQIVVVDLTHKWATHFIDLGIQTNQPTKQEIADYQPDKIIDYLDNARSVWSNIGDFMR